MGGRIQKRARSRAPVSGMFVAQKVRPANERLARGAPNGYGPFSHRGVPATGGILSVDSANSLDYRLNSSARGGIAKW